MSAEEGVSVPSESLRRHGSRKSMLVSDCSSPSWRLPRVAVRTETGVPS
jgi:hypothetical protein